MWLLSFTLSVLLYAVRPRKVKAVRPVKTRKINKIFCRERDRDKSRARDTRCRRWSRPALFRPVRRPRLSPQNLRKDGRRGRDMVRASARLCLPLRRAEPDTNRILKRAGECSILLCAQRAACQVEERTFVYDMRTGGILPLPRRSNAQRSKICHFRADARYRRLCARKVQQKDFGVHIQEHETAIQKYWPRGQAVSKGGAQKGAVKGKTKSQRRAVVFLKRSFPNGYYSPAGVTYKSLSGR